MTHDMTHMCHKKKKWCYQLNQHNYARGLERSVSRYLQTLDDDGDIRRRNCPVIVYATTSTSQLLRWWATRQVPERVLLCTELVPATGTPAYKLEARSILPSRGIKVCHILKYICNYGIKEFWNTVTVTTYIQ